MNTPSEGIDLAPAPCNAPRMDVDIITSGDAARILEVHPATLVRWVDKGEVATVGRLPNGTYLFSRAVIVALAAERAA